jgi:hypothetical protein
MEKNAAAVLRRILCIFIFFISLGFSPSLISAPAWRSARIRESTINENGKKSEKSPRIYAVQLNLSAPLPHTLFIAGDAERQKKVAHIFSPYRAQRQRVEAALENLGDLSPQALLALFKTGRKYTYTIIKDRLYFAQIDAGAKNKYLTKHFFVANYPEALYFAGECWTNDQQSLVIDNNSGTYRPTAAALPEVAATLQKSLGLPVTISVYL